jgi:hypothetical protein
MKNFLSYFKRENWMNPGRNSCRCVASTRNRDLKPSKTSNPAAAKRDLISNAVKILLLIGATLLVSFPSHAGSIRDVSHRASLSVCYHWR